jgi:hypothetical protein
VKGVHERFVCVCDAFIDVYGDLGCGKALVLVDASPGMMNDWAYDVVAAFTCGADCFSDNFKAGFLNEKDVNSGL